MDSILAIESSGDGVFMLYRLNIDFLIGLFFRLATEKHSLLLFIVKNDNKILTSTSFDTPVNTIQFENVYAQTILNPTYIIYTNVIGGGSIVLDPWRSFSTDKNIKVIHYGNTRN